MFKLKFNTKSSTYIIIYIYIILYYYTLTNTKCKGTHYIPITLIKL